MRQAELRTTCGGGSCGRRSANAGSKRRGYFWLPLIVAKQKLRNLCWPLHIIFFYVKSSDFDMFKANHFSS